MLLNNISVTQNEIQYMYITCPETQEKYKKINVFHSIQSNSGNFKI